MPRYRPYAVVIGDNDIERPARTVIWLHESKRTPSVKEATARLRAALAADENVFSVRPVR